MTAPRFLIDENLSPALVKPAHLRGFEAMHVNHLGLRMETDWDLLKVIAEHDWVLVTNNAIEFRGRYRTIKWHPGVISCCQRCGVRSSFTCLKRRWITSARTATW